MNIRDFEYIVQIAKFNSISKAAESLYISQPTLTKFLQRVEKELSYPLFYRNGKKLVPTQIGEIYISKALKIIDLNTQLEQEIKDSIDFKLGTIKIGVTAGRSNFITDIVLPNFSSSFPDIKVLIEIQYSDRLIEMLDNDDIDIAIATGNKKQSNLEYTEIGQDELVILARSDSRIVKKSKKVDGFKFNVVTPEDWANEKFVLTSAKSMSMTLANEYFRSVDKYPKVIAQVQDVRAAIATVSSGVGIGLFVSVPIKKEHNLCYLSLGTNDLSRQTVSVVTKQKEYLPRSTEKLLEIIKESYIHY